MIADTAMGTCIDDQCLHSLTILLPARRHPAQNRNCCNLHCWSLDGSVAQHLVVVLPPTPTSPSRTCVRASIRATRMLACWWECVGWCGGYHSLTQVFIHSFTTLHSTRRDADANNRFEGEVMAEDDECMGCGCEGEEWEPENRAFRYGLFVLLRACCRVGWLLRLSSSSTGETKKRSKDRVLRILLCASMLRSNPIGCTTVSSTHVADLK